MKTHYFCIAHKDVLYDLPEETNVICTGRYNISSAYNIINSSKRLYENYDKLKGLTGTFFINELLKNFDENDYVQVMAYRKFVSNKKFSYENWQVEIPKSSLVHLNVKEHIRNIHEEFCFSHPMYIGSTVSQYNDWHIIQDFLRLTACAVDLNILTKNDVIKFMNYPIIIPGGVEIGKFPIKVYKEITDKLEMVANLFLKECKITDDIDPTQNRALSFSIERLSSWLLINYLENRFDRHFIKNHDLIKQTPNLLIDKNALNFNEFFGYLYMIS